MITPLFTRKKNRPEIALVVQPLPTPLPILPIVQTDHIHRVRQRDLEQFITSIFGFDFDTLLATGQTPGMALTYRVSPEFPSDAWGDRAHMLRCGVRQKDMNLILTTLCVDGLIPGPATYVIDTTEESDPADTHQP